MPESTPLHSLVIDGLGHDVSVLHFEGFEGLSQLFEFEVTIASETPIAFADVVRKKAKLAIGSPREAGPAHPVHGVVARLQEVEHLSRWTEYRVTIVPWAWLLQHRMDARIFQEKTAPAIVQAVLQGAGYSSGTDFALSLQGTYGTREYCVQYRESDWDFVCRLLEEEGIYYYFDQSGSTEKLVLVDKVASLSPVEGSATLPFVTTAGGGLDRDMSVASLNVSDEVRPGKVTLRDWNFEKPALLLEAQAEDAKDTDLEVYDYPGDYAVPADGTTVSAVREKELAASRRVARGESSCTNFYPGYSFTLSDHPHDALNANYLLTRVEHWGTEPHGVASEAPPETREARTGYANRFEVIPSTVEFRPPRVTRRPQIHGVQTAIVVGPAGEEIYVDKYGRVKVQFHWDRLGKKDDKSSCWIRVAQFWASAAYGAMFIPRISDEVVVTFLEGDPDRPLIVGSVYHGTNVPPYTLPDDKTKSTIKSNTSPGGGGSNELRFEDKKGSEEVFLHAQKDWTIGVENDKSQKVGHDETLEVDNDRTKTVKHDQTATIEHDDTLTVKHDQTLAVNNDRTVTVDNDHTETVKGKQSLTVDKAQTVALKDDQTITIDKKRSITVTGDVSETYKAKLTVNVTGDVSETLSAKRTISVSGDFAETISGKQSITVQSDSSETVSGKKSFSVNGDVTITSGGSTVTIKPSGEITVSGAQITIDASGPLKLHGATVDVKSDGPMTIKAPLINGNADATHTVKGAVVTLDGQMVNVG